MDMLRTSERFGGCKYSVFGWHSYVLTGWESFGDSRISLDTAPTEWIPVSSLNIPGVPLPLLCRAVTPRAEGSTWCQHLAATRASDAIEVCIFSIPAEQ